MMKNRIVLAIMLVFTSVFFCACARNMGTKTAEGMKLVEAMAYDEAISAFKAALEGGEEEIYAYRGLGIAQMGVMDYEAAAESFSLALEENGMKIDDLTYDIDYYLAAAYYKLGRYEDAVRLYDAIITMRPKEQDAYFLRGNARLMNGDETEAKKDFDYALTVATRPVDLSVDIYVSFETAGNPDGGKVYLSNALSYKKGELTDYEAGRLYYYMGEYKAAAECLERLREKAAADANALLMLGQTYEALGDYNYAASVYAKYVEAVPSPDAATAGIYNRLGLLYMNGGDYENALNAFHDAMLIPDNGMMQALRFNEVVALERNGDFTEACRLLGEYLKIYPDDTAAQKEYTFLQSR